MSKYALGQALTTGHLFDKFDRKKLLMDGKITRQYKCDSHKDDLINRIMRACAKLVVDDIIENNATFRFPTGGKKCFLRMEGVSGENFARARRKGMWKDVDFLMSDFTGYRLTMEYENRGKRKRKKVYVGKRDKDRITEYTNQGKKYF